VFIAASGKAIQRAVRISKLRSAGLTLDSPKAKQFMGPFESPMNRREAALILGVRESAPEDKIVAAHRRLMLLNHPDNGGSNYLAMKVNEAKELLLLK
jgi:DnaJ family protein C protein 19